MLTGDRKGKAHTQGGGGVLPEKLGGGVWPTSQNPTLFVTKICDIAYPICDPIWENQA